MTIWVQLQLQYQHSWPVCILGSMCYREMKKETLFEDTSKGRVQDS